AEKTYINIQRWTMIRRAAISPPWSSRRRWPGKSRRSSGRCAKNLFGQPARFDRVDLQRDVAAVDPALRERPAGEPQARMPGPGPHVAQLLGVVIKAPDPADALGHVSAEQRADQMVDALVAGGENDEVRLPRRAVLQHHAISREPVDIRCLDQADSAVGDQFGGADIEIIAAAAGPEF